MPRSAAPFSSRWVPPPSLVAMLARFSFWPLAFVGARALSRAHPTLVTFLLILGSLVVSSVVSRARTRRVIVSAIVVGSFIVAIPAFAAAGLSMFAVGVPFGVAFALLVGALAGGLFALTARKVDEPTLEDAALALLPAGAWMALAAVTARFGAEAVHLHIVIPTVSRVIAAAALVLGTLGVAIVLLQRRWTERLYRGELPWTVTTPPSDAAATPRLSRVPESDMVVIRPPGAPYREERSSLARVPKAGDALIARHSMHGRLAGLATLFALSSSLLVFGSCASAAHSANTIATPAKLPPLPARCETSPPRIRLVALEPAHLIEIEQIAARYRRLGLASVEVEAPLPFEDRFYDHARTQLVAEEIGAAARRAYQPHSRDLIVVLTDRDMFIRAAPWRYAFANGDGRVSVISIARMRTSFTWHPPASYEPREPECAAMLNARMYKMITRAILRNACEAPPIDDPRSARRLAVLSLDDLDVIDEDFY